MMIAVSLTRTIVHVVVVAPTHDGARLRPANGVQSLDR